MNINDITITSLEVITAFDITTGNFKFALDELQNATIAQTQEKTDITGKQGRKLASLKRNKAVTISGTNGMVSGGLLELQTGSEFENKVTTVMWTDYLTVYDNGAVTSYKAVGTIGNEIESVYIKNSDGTLGAPLMQGAAVADHVFTYDPATKKIAFNEGEVADGTEIVVYYLRQIQADVLENMSDNYSGKCSLYIDAFAEDKCANVYRIQFYVPKADFNGEFSFEMGDNQTVHAFEAESLAGACGSSGALWTYTIFGVNAEDAEANPLMSADRLTIPAKNEVLLGKKVSDMIGEDVAVYADGSVIGTLKNVTGFEEFNSANKDEQSGHYFPFRLAQTGKTMTLKKNGVAAAGKKDMTFDPEIIFRVESKDTTFTVEVDGKDVVTLNFKKATFA